MRYQPFAILLLMFAVGCSSKNAVNLTLKNDTPYPLTLRLTKEGPNHEYFWTSPEDQVDARVVVWPDHEPGGWKDVDGGELVTTKHVTYDFEKGGHPILRVYFGNRLKLGELLAMAPGGSRVDVVLHPGDNVYAVHEKDGQLSVDPVEPPPAVH